MNFERTIENWAVTAYQEVMPNGNWGKLSEPQKDRWRAAARKLFNKRHTRVSKTAL
jgi:hypothetical protein